MGQLALKGNATRGKEVIEILEMLGGKNPNSVYSGKDTFHYYYIDNETGYVTTKLYTDNCLTKLTYNIFTLEEFFEKFPYKIGDRVKIPNCDVACRVTNMIWNGIEIEYETTNSEETVFADELQPYKKETMERKPNLLQQLKEYFDNTPREVLEKEWNELSYLNEIGPTVDEYLECVKKYRQSNQYPKTYEECCKILKIEYPYFKTEEDGISASTYKNKLFGALKQLLICRDAYWKLAGEQMGLGKSWEPDFKDDSDKYFICYVKDEVWMSNIRDCNKVLVFPTEEIRDLFYQNFKELIEIVKELI